MKYVMSLLAFLFSANLLANDFIRCVDSEPIRKRFKAAYLSVYKPGNGECWISIHPDNQWPVYRDFMFGDQSFLMIFASLGAGSPSTDTGARMFSFFPRATDLAYSLDENAQKVIIKVPSGATFTFDLAQHELESFTGLNVIDHRQVTRSNRGGMEISPLNTGIVLDEGWRLGELPRTLKGKTSQFEDAHGNKCTVKNGDIFDLEYDPSGGINGAVLKFVTDEDLRDFLVQDCPKIDTSDL